VNLMNPFGAARESFGAARVGSPDNHVGAIAG